MIESLNLNRRILEMTKMESDKKAYDTLKVFLFKNITKIKITALPAIKLYMYNFIAKNPKADVLDLEREFQKINRLSELENEYANTENILPTIGIEIEIPEENLTLSRVKILDKLEIPNHEERVGDLWEVNPDFSYSPSVQARIIQELAKMNALPLKENPKNSKTKVISEKLLSLHVNFGMPIEITEDTMHQNRDNFALVNDTITYAYSSPERILGRKSTISFEFEDDAQESKKNVKRKKEDAYVWDSSGKKILMRFELRALEFRNYPSYRMLSEAQRLTALLISHITLAENKNLSEKNRTMVELWQKFEQEVKSLFDKFELETEMIDNKKGKKIVAELLTGPNPENEAVPALQEECRKIATKYSLEVAKALKIKDEIQDI